MKTRSVTRPIIAVILITFTLNTPLLSGLEMLPTERFSRQLLDPLSYREPIPPLIHDGRIFAPAKRGNVLVALDLKGEKIWEARVRGRIASTPAVIRQQGDGTEWIVVVTDRNELWAFDKVSGDLRIYRVSLETTDVPSGEPLIQLADGRTLLIVMRNSLIYFDLVRKRIVRERRLNLTVEESIRLGGRLLVYNKKEVAIVGISDGSVEWKVELDEEIVAIGTDGRFIALLLNDGRFAVLDANEGKRLWTKDIRGLIGLEMLTGRIPVVRGVAALAGSKSLAFIELGTKRVFASLSAERSVAQPIAVGRAIIVLSNEGRATVFHLGRWVRLGEFAVDAIPFGEVVVADVTKSSSLLIYHDESLALRVLEVPNIWISVQSAEEIKDGYRVEGFVCDTRLSGEALNLSLFIMDDEGNIVLEKDLGFLPAGRCGGKFIVTMPSKKGALGLKIDGEPLPPIVPVGLSREEWSSIGAAPPPTMTTTPAPVPVGGLEVYSPPEVLVGEDFDVEVSGINRWEYDKLQLKLIGEVAQETSAEVRIEPGGTFFEILSTKALRPGAGLILRIESNGVVLDQVSLSTKVVRGDVIEDIAVPMEVEFGKGFLASVTIVNRYEDGVPMAVVAKFGNQTLNRTLGRLRAGESKNVTFMFTGRETGEVTLEVSVYSDETLVDSKIKTVYIRERAVPPPAPTTPAPSPTTPPPPSPSVFPPSISPIMLGAILAAIAAVAVIALAVRRRKPPEERPKLELQLETVRPAALEEIEKALEKEEVPAEEAPLPKLEEILKEPEEELGEIELPKEAEIEEKAIEIEEVEREEIPEKLLEIEEEEEVPIPEVEEAPPSAVPKEEEVEEIAETPLERRERLEKEISSLRSSLESVRERLRALEEELGLDLSMERIDEMESMLVMAEGQLESGDLETAERSVTSVKESLGVLENEIADAHSSLVENWESVESRIDIMLRVWGKAPASMLTMVPPSFRLAALRRFMSMHPERKLELRGDELYSLEEEE